MFTLAHVHLLLNHLPIIITALGLVLLGAAMIGRSATLIRTAFAFFVAAAVVTLPTYLTGEPAATVINGLPGVVDSITERHETAALRAALVVGALGLYAAWVLWRHRRDVELPRTAVRVALAGAVVGSALMAWTGFLGGQVRHTEVRADTTAAGVSPRAPASPGVEP